MNIQTNKMLPLILIPIAFISLSHSQSPIVTTPLGKISGHHQTSFEERIFSAFEGIPYAKAPTGSRRFKEPEPIEKWNGIKEATSVYQCAQGLPLKFGNVITDNEDCLHVNVYVPRNEVNSSERLDVIVHIHGGCFITGSGHESARPHYLMDHEVIWVTFNYRLGIFGFLSTEDEVLPGNNGMKDQVLALKWVQTNIASFGGNPNSVTITGHSAGGASVQLHYLSPMSHGLFHQGLSRSGSALNPWCLQRGALDKAKVLANAVGCDRNSTKDLVECLRGKSAEELLTHDYLYSGYYVFPICFFGPVVEKGSKGFLTENPQQLLKDKKVQDLPWVASFVKDESHSLIEPFEDKLEELNQDWKTNAQFILNYNYTIPKERWEAVADKSKEFYLGDSNNVTKDNFKNFIQLSTDKVNVDGVARAAKLQANATKSSVYVYEMSYPGSNKEVVNHGDDNNYFFYSGMLPSEDEAKMKDVMVNMLVTYAKTGKPSLNDVDWKPVKPGDFTFLNVSGFRNEDIRSETNNNLANANLWDSLGFAGN